MHSLHFFLRGGLCVRVSYSVPILLQIFYQPVHCSFELFVAGMLVFDAAFQQGSAFLPRFDDGGEPFIVCNGNVSSLHALLLRLGEGGTCLAPTFVPLPQLPSVTWQTFFIYYHKNSSLCMNGITYLCFCGIFSCTVAI